MIDDSGNAPTLFALDTNGIDRGAWRVVGAKNTDWESLSTGPCAATSDANKDCVYIGDTGDNTERRPERAIYRLVEPEAKGGDDTVHASRLRYVYADGPHDVEAMYVAKNGDVLLITKRPRTNATGQLRPALVFALPTSGAWDKDSVRTARLVDSLPIIPGAQPLMTITDAALSPDGKHLAVRTYVQTYIFATDSVTGRVNHAVTPSICDVTRLGEPQGEAVTWVDDRGRLAFTSEGKNQPLRSGNCRLP